MNKKWVILASGEGSLFEAIAQACESGELKSQISLLITNKDLAPVLQKAYKYKIPTLCLSFKDPLKSDKELCEILKKEEPQLILLAGFLKKIGPQTLEAFPKTIWNIHPSLLPQFGGEGMYGLAVHRAVLESRAFQTGVTLHIVGAHYDTGPILAQEKIAIEEGLSVQELQEKVKIVEKRFYVSTLKAWEKGVL